MTTALMIEWFEAYSIDHKVSYTSNVPASVAPIGKLAVSKTGSHYRVNGKVVSRKFVTALRQYYQA